MDIVILSMRMLLGLKTVGRWRLAITLPFHSLYDISELFTDLSILVELRLEVSEDGRAEHALRRGV